MKIAEYFREFKIILKYGAQNHVMNTIKKSLNS